MGEQGVEGTLQAADGNSEDQLKIKFHTIS